MAKFKIEEHFNMRSVSPSSMQQDNIIMFSYKSPNGVHDTMPLILVHEKQIDRVYGINLHYAPQLLQEAVANIQKKVMPYLEQEYYKKYPENKQKLKEQRIPFSKSLITEAEYVEIMKRFPQQQLEQFLVTKQGMDAMRCYLYQRMTSVSKLVWKG